MLNKILECFKCLQQNIPNEFDYELVNEMVVEVQKDKREAQLKSLEEILI